jgi:hypothetical protein
VSTATTAVQMTKDIVTALGVVVGGGWAYLKFARGRLFAPRAELAIKATVHESAEGLMTIAVVTLANRGVRRLHLKPDYKVLYVYRLDSSIAATPTAPSETKIAITPILTAHDWLETAEQVSEEVTVLLPLKSDGAESPGRTSFRLEAQVWAPRPRGRETGVRWSSSVTIPGPGWTAVKDGQ